MSELFPSAESVYSGPDAAGFFGAYGGRFVPETVIPALEELTAAYEDAVRDPEFEAELDEPRVDVSQLSGR